MFTRITVTLLLFATVLLGVVAPSEVSADGPLVLARTEPGALNGKSTAEFSGRGYTVEQFTRFTLADSGYRAFLGPLFQARGRVIAREDNSTLGPVLVLSQEGVESRLVGGDNSAISEALSLAYQGMLKANFPAEVVGVNFPWRIVFLNGIPRPLNSHMLSSSQCHAAWMGPPATIVVALDRLNPRCYGQLQTGGSRSRKDALVGILLHEIGHAIEFRLMGRAFGRRQRWHSEGFAQWFELYVRGALEKDYVLHQQKKKEAKIKYNSSWRGEFFRGTKKDYLISWSYYSAVVQKHGVSGLLRVYQAMDSGSLSFSEATEKELGLTHLAWRELVEDFLAGDAAS